MKPIIRDFADLAAATRRLWTEHPDFTPHQVSEALEAEYEISASVKLELTRQAVEGMPH